jgi:DNA gyrase subunit A
MVVVDDPHSTYLLTACRHGYGKRTPLDDYPVKGRGGLGVINIQAKPGGRNGDVIGVRLCRDEDDVMYITEGGMIVRSPVGQTRPMGRNVQGVRMVNLRDGDALVALEIVSRKDLESYGVVEDDETEDGSTLLADPQGAAGAPQIDPDAEAEDDPAPSEEE